MTPDSQKIRKDDDVWPHGGELVGDVIAHGHGYDWQQDEADASAHLHAAAGNGPVPRSDYLHHCRTITQPIGIYM